MHGLIRIRDVIPNLMKENNIEECTNFRRNFYQYLLKIILDDYQYYHWINGNNIPRSHNLEQLLKNALKKRHPQANNETDLLINIDEFIPFFMEECLENFLDTSSEFASYYLHLLICDSQDGIDFNVESQGISVCEIERFLLSALAKYKNPLDATVCSMKIAFYCRNSKQFRLNFVKDKYELDFSTKLKGLVKSILQYPENSSSKQLEEMFLKMQVFIITKYQIGHPENHVILNQCRQSLYSILGKGDIQKYVLRKRYHRLEYLQKLGDTAAGILIFNNQGPEGDKENVCNIFADLKMAKCNTIESFQEGFDRVFCLKQKAFKVLLEIVEINVQQEIIYCLRHLTQIRELNKFVVLFEVYARNLENVKTEFKKTQYLIESDQKKFDMAVEKINGILKYRSAIESELIFPHFVYLSEIWNSLVLYLNHLVEINKSIDRINDLLSQQTEFTFNELLEDLSDNSKHLKPPAKYIFQEVINSTAKVETKLNMLNIKQFIKHYCALTIGLTGLLVPSKLDKKLCEDIDLRFGFANMEYAKFAEHHFKSIIKVILNTILTSSDLIVLFELDDKVMQQDFESTQLTQAQTKTSDTQTEVIFDEIISKTRIQATWNIWDFHRHTIKCANIRKKQTQSTQSKLTYGMRNAQTQCKRKSNNATQN